MTNFKLKTQFQIIWACFALHNYIRRYDSNDVNMLEQFEDITEVEHIEKKNNGDNDDSSDDNAEDDNNKTIWEEPTQEEVRMMEQLRNRIRDQLPQRVRH
ncbi:hypothetical protein PIB30_106243 [Stylosanthes scabra]|uniref:Uncharacterized protein n=1 Tax=Stylosanthes scabra TaxID=79078 RepID=A0ABU6QZW6_9FABA|nr:hypothetical protein [Stylosanthes scabra]